MSHRHARFLIISLGLSLMAHASAQTTVTFWNTNTSPIDIKGYTKIVDSFNRANPGIKVKLVQVVGSETDSAKLTSAVAGGTGPDVYLLDRFTVAERAASGVLTNLDSYVKAVPNLAAQYLPFAWKETQFKNSTYALPFDTDVRMLYYRKDVLKAAGVDLAQFDPKNGPINSKRLMEIVSKVNKTDSTGAYTQVGFIPWYGQGWHYTWGYAYGGKFADAKGCQVTPTDAGVTAGYQFLADAAKALDPKKAQTFLSTYAAPTNPPAQDPFVTGKMALEITGDWMAASLQEYAPKAQWGMTYVPTPDGKKVSWSGGWSAVIPKGAKNEAAAFKFMQYMTGAPGQRIYVKDTKHFPTYKSLLSENNLYGPEQQFERTLLTSSLSRPNLPVGALYWDELTRAQNAVVLGTGSVESSLAAVKSRVQPRLNRFCR